MFKITPKEDFSNFKAGKEYLVLKVRESNSQLKILTYDDKKYIAEIPADKFLFAGTVEPTDKTTSPSPSDLTPQQKAAITRQKNKKAKEN